MEVHMLKEMRLKYRILLGYAAPIVLFIIASVVVYSFLRTADEARAAAEEKRAIMSVIGGLMYNSAKMQRAARGYIIAKNEVSKKSFEDGEAEFSRLVERLGNLVRDEKQKERLKMVIGLEKDVSGLGRNFIALVDKGKQDVAVREFKTGAPLEAARRFEAAVMDFERAEAEILEASQKAESSALASVTRVLYAATFLAALAAAVIGFYISSAAGRSIMEVINTVSSSSAEIAATVSQHERTASGQAAMVNQTTATVEELGASFRKTSEQAASVADTAKKASALTDEGARSVKAAVDGMNELKEKISAVAGEILKLGEQTAQIGSIADVVKDLAGQTNMLALNAAVEAVRAGEHGKGFSVLAAEVRKLADESKKSAQKANVIIEEIQKATNSTIMVTEEGAKRVEEVIRLAGAVGGLFDKLSDAAGSVYENAQQALLNTKQQSGAIGQVVDAVNNINAGARETAAGLSQTRTGVTKLNEAAVGLKAMV